MAFAVDCTLLCQSVTTAPELVCFHGQAIYAQGVIVGFKGKRALVRFEIIGGVALHFNTSFTHARHVYDRHMSSNVLYRPEDSATADIDDFNPESAPILIQANGELALFPSGSSAHRFQEKEKQQKRTP